MQKEELKFYYNSTPCLLFCQWLFRAHFSLIAGIFVTLFWPSLPIFAQIKSWGKSIAMRSFEFVIICCTGIIRITLYTIWSPPLPLTQIIQCHFLGGFFFGGGGGGVLTWLPEQGCKRTEYFSNNASDCDQLYMKEKRLSCAFEMWFYFWCSSLGRYQTLL